MRKILIILLLLVACITLTSCATVRDVRPDGSYTEYRRVGNQEIGRLVLADPISKKVMILEGQSSLNDEFIEKMTAGIVNGLIKGMVPR